MYTPCCRYSIGSGMNNKHLQGWRGLAVKAPKSAFSGQLRRPAAYVSRGVPQLSRALAILQGLGHTARERLGKGSEEATNGPSRLRH